MVKTATQWERRRLEIFEDFDREIYGRIPERTPAIRWEVVSEKDRVNGDCPVTTKRLVGHVDRSEYPGITVDIKMTLTTPGGITEPVPVFMEFGWEFPEGFRRPKTNGPTWEQQVLEKGWGYAILIPTSIQDDHGAGLRQGIIGLVNRGKPRRFDDWGAWRPRPVFISVGSPDVEGQWIDAKGMFLAGVHAGPVYELLGKKGLGITEYPPQETTVIDGEIAFRQHAGGHTLDPNWPVFIKFTERYLAK